MHIMFKCSVEFSLSYAVGTDLLFAIKNKYLINLALNHVVFDENQTCFLFKFV